MFRLRSELPEFNRHKMFAISYEKIEPKFGDSRPKQEGGNARKT